MVCSSSWNVSCQLKDTLDRVRKSIVAYYLVITLDERQSRFKLGLTVFVRCSILSVGRSGHCVREDCFGEIAKIG